MRTTYLSRLAAILIFAMLIALLIWSYSTGGIVHALIRSDYAADEKIVALKAFFGQFGAWAPAAYVAFVTAEVVIAPLPGAMLYAPGGVIFGGFWGGLLSLTGNVLGAGVACQLMRTMLGARVENYVARSALSRYETGIVQHGTWVIFLLRVNPLTSSDLVSYAAGLTRIAVWKVMLGTLAGMAPLCFAQAYLADGLLTAFPRLIYPLLVLCAVYVLIVFWIISKAFKT